MAAGDAQTSSISHQRRQLGCGAARPRSRGPPLSGRPWRQRQKLEQQAMLEGAFEQDGRANKTRQCYFLRREDAAVQSRLSPDLARPSTADRASSSTWSSTVQLRPRENWTGPRLQGGQILTPYSPRGHALRDR